MAGKHVLIVDDDMEFVRLYSLFLKNKGLEISAVYSAGEALGAIDELSPDIVVLDVMMEHFDSGFNVSKSIKEGPRRPAGHTDDRDRRGDRHGLQAEER